MRGLVRGLVRGFQLSFWCTDWCVDWCANWCVDWRAEDFKCFFGAWTGAWTRLVLLLSHLQTAVGSESINIVGELKHGRTEVVGSRRNLSEVVGPCRKSWELVGRRRKLVGIWDVYQCPPPCVLKTRQGTLDQTRSDSSDKFRRVPTRASDQPLQVRLASGTENWPEHARTCSNKYWDLAVNGGQKKVENEWRPKIFGVVENCLVQRCSELKFLRYFFMRCWWSSRC